MSPSDWLKKCNAARGGQWLMTLKEGIAFYGVVLFVLLACLFMVLVSYGVL